MSSIVLVTGAAGFIGSHVCDHCLRLGFRVVAVDDLSGGFRENVPAGAVFRQGSVSDRAFIDGLFKEFRFDTIYHLAAYAAEGLSHFIRHFNYENNLQGSILLINAAVNHGMPNFVFTSSIAVYGPNQTPMTEAMTPQPEDPYGIAKYAVELDLGAAHEMFGLNYYVFRPHNVYGERQNVADRYRNVIGIFMNQVMQGKPMTVFGDGKQTRAFSYIDDVAPIIAKAPQVPSAANQVFNIGADTPYTILELGSEIASAFGVSPEFTHLDARKEVVDAFATHDKVRSIFAPSAPVALRDGIRRMAAWVKARGPLPATVFQGIEVDKNMPPAWKVTR